MSAFGESTSVLLDRRPLRPILERIVGQVCVPDQRARFDGRRCRGEKDRPQPARHPRGCFELINREDDVYPKLTDAMDGVAVAPKWLSAADLERLPFLGPPLPRLLVKNWPARLIRNGSVIDTCRRGHVRLRAPCAASAPRRARRFEFLSKWSCISSVNVFSSALMCSCTQLGVWPPVPGPPPPSASAPRVPNSATRASRRGGPASLRLIASQLLPLLSHQECCPCPGRTPRPRAVT